MLGTVLGLGCKHKEGPCPCPCRLVRRWTGGEEGHSGQRGDADRCHSERKGCTSCGPIFTVYDGPSLEPLFPMTLSVFEGWIGTMAGQISLDTDLNYVLTVCTFYERWKEVQLNKCILCMGVILLSFSPLVWMLRSSVSSFSRLPRLHLEFRLALWVCIFLSIWLSTLTWYRHCCWNPLLSFLNLLSVGPFGEVPSGILASALLAVWETSDRALGKSGFTVILVGVKCS